MAITNYLVHFKTEDTYNDKKSELRNDAVAFVKNATIIHTHGTDYYCGSGPVALKSDLSGYATTSALTSGLAGKANTSHTHTIANITNLQSTLDGKAASSHTHSISQISGLQTELDSKLESVSLSDLGVTATAAELNYVDGVTSNIQTQLNGKAASSHTHTTSQVSGLATVATSGSYDDLTNKPSIPAAYTLPTASASTLGGVKIGSGINISSGVISVTTSSIGAATATHTHSQYLTSSSLSGYATQSWVEDQGYLTSVPAQSWSSITGKPSTFTPAAHTHSADDITSGTLAIARIPTGTTSSTVALGNHTHSGYATTSQLNNYLPLSGGSMTGGIDLSNATSSVGSAPDCVLALGGKKIDLGGGFRIGDYGGVFKYGDHVVLTEANYSDYISSTDTKNTTGTSNSTSKLYLAGGTTQSSTGVVTYSNSSVYTQSGSMYAKSFYTTGTTTNAVITDTVVGVLSSKNRVASIGTTGIGTNKSIWVTSGVDDQAAKTITLTGGTGTFSDKVNATNGFYETSDARLKNFKDDIKALDVVSEIPTKYFTWKKDEIVENIDPELHIGTSAQEIQKFYPDLVTADEDGILSVDYARLSIIALAAIKELKAEVDKLKQQNTKFKV